LILSFTSTLGSVTENTAVPLIWNASGDAARIETLAQNNALLASQSVPLVGQVALPALSGAGRAVQFRLVVTRGGVEVEARLMIAIVCAQAWFFGDATAPPGTPCPQGPSAVIDGAFQQMERGLLLYTGSALNRVYGLINDGQRFLSIPNGWDGSSIVTDPAPPAGLFAPQGVLNWFFYRTLAPLGANWPTTIGWGFAATVVENRTLQFESGTGAFFIDGPGGQLFHITAGDSGTWTKIR
jgi:hypothetical protein